MKKSVFALVLLATVLTASAANHGDGRRHMGRRDDDDDRVQSVPDQGSTLALAGVSIAGLGLASLAIRRKSA